MTISDPTPKDHIQRWQLSIERIYNEVTEIHSNRQIWEYLNEELPRHGGQIIHQTTTRWYVDSQVAAIRRITSDRSQDGHSLYKLLKSIDTYVADFGGGKWGVTVTHETVQNDMATLKQAASGIIRWADEHVAHMGRKSTANPTFGNLDSAITLLGELFAKYNLVITGGQIDDVTPVIQDDWKRPFRTAWL